MSSTTEEIIIQEEQPQEITTTHGIEHPTEIKYPIALLIFLSVWCILGIAAFVYSLMCFGSSGTMVEKIIGLLLALFFGPFYFIYYKFSNTYCKSNSFSGGKKYKKRK